MTPDEQAAVALQRSADRLASIIGRLASQGRTSAFRIPELDADPVPDDPTNMWLLSDHRMRIRFSDGFVDDFVPVSLIRPAVPTFSADPAASTGWTLWSLTSGAVRLRLANGTVETIFTGSTSTSGGTPAGGSGTSGSTRTTHPAPKRYYREYRSQWSQIYCEVHGAGEESGTLHYGRFDSTHGERKIMIGFDDAQIRTDTAGSTIKQVRLRALNTYSWAFGGISIHWGAHNQHTAPGSFSAVRGDAYIGSWPRSGWGGGAGHWRTVPNWFGSSLRNNQIKGVTVDQPTGRTSYGELDAGSVTISIEYVK